MLEWLKSTSPIAGAALGVGYCNDLSFARKLAEDNRKGISTKHHSPRPVEIGWKQTRLPTRLFDGRVEFFKEAIRR